MIPTPQVSEDIQDDESYSGCCWSCGMQQDTPLESGDYCGFCGNCSESHESESESDTIEYCISCEGICPGCYWTAARSESHESESESESDTIEYCISCGGICPGCCWTAARSESHR